MLLLLLLSCRPTPQQDAACRTVCATVGWRYYAAEQVIGGVRCTCSLTATETPVPRECPEIELVEEAGP